MSTVVKELTTLELSFIVFQYEYSSMHVIYQVNAVLILVTFNVNEVIASKYI